MPYMHAARTNLSSDGIRIHGDVIGESTFRTCLSGTFSGGTRNGQDAACKRFKPHFRDMEDEYYAQDFRIVKKVVMIATAWNDFCEGGTEILVNRGTIQRSRSGIKYLVEPLIRGYEKFTSNTGYILGDTDRRSVRCMEAFSHYSYHRTGGRMIVCDLQGRYKWNRFVNNKSRFELSDPAICSTERQYGPTDMGEKGIDSFFANHCCNEFCQSHWMKPVGQSRCWFPQSSGSTMLSSRCTRLLSLDNPTDFRRNRGIPWANGLGRIFEDDDDDDDSD